MKWIGAKLFFERIFLKRLNNPGSDTDKFLVAKSDGEVGFRTGAEVLSDIGSGDITSVSFTGDSGSQVDNASGAVEFAIEGGDGISTTMGTNKVTISGSDASASAAGIVELATTAETTTGTATTLAVTPDGLKDGYEGSTNVDTLGTISTGTWQGTSIATTYTAAKVTSIVAGEGVDVSGATGDVTVSGEDATTSNKGIASFDTNHFTVASGAVKLKHAQIKILPHHFMSNEDGGANKSAQFRDDTIIGVRATHNDAELYAFVEIPVGYTATRVDVYGNDTGLAVNVYESDINAGALTDKTPGGGCTVGSACDITDVESDSTNYLVVKVTILSYTNDIVYGGTVTLTAS
tara:strand:- start:1385 stop:2431 length:1047 start_codon:yes stop_codon:yes gene_type:complete